MTLGQGESQGGQISCRFEPESIVVDPDAKVLQPQTEKRDREVLTALRAGSRVRAVTESERSTRKPGQRMRLMVRLTQQVSAIDAEIANRSTFPDGQVTSTDSMRSISPRPKWSRGSEADW